MVMAEIEEVTDVGPDERLGALRVEIDHIDEQLADLIARRMQAVTQIGTIKREVGAPVIALGRDMEVRDRFATRCEAAGVPRAVGHEIIGLVMRVGYGLQGAVSR
jgi:chorismate mutase / prephenate dehydrogenase